MTKISLANRDPVHNVLGKRCTRQCIHSDLKMPGNFKLEIADVIRKHHLRWLGHVARMKEARLPKQMLFGKLPCRRPRHGPKKRWRDVVSSDFAVIGLPEADWYDTAQERSSWFQCCRQRVEKEAPDIPCPNYRCDRVFRRPGDLKRHAQYCRFRVKSLSVRKPSLSLLRQWAFKVQGSRCVCVCVCVCACVCARVCVCVDVCVLV